MVSWLNFFNYSHRYEEVAMTSRASFFTILLVFVASETFAQMPGKKHDSLEPGNTSGVPSFALLNINNLTSWIQSNGKSNHSPAGMDGLIFPRGTASVVYQDGITWGAKVFTGGPEGVGVAAAEQPIRIGGGTYQVGTMEGYVIGSGATAFPLSPADPTARAYRIRRDYSLMTDGELRKDAAEFYEIDSASVTIQQRDAIFAQYVTDWQEWPVQYGAPYIERNGMPGFQPPPSFNSTFTPDSLLGSYDEPGVALGDPDDPADQVLWTVYNDLNSAVTQVFSGSMPLGLEIQKTVWGYKGDSHYFVRHRLINKGGADIDSSAGNQLGSFWLDSMYVCQWSDPDLGNAADDLLGCDSLTSLGFTWNHNPTDLKFTPFGLPPPSVGYDILAGPLVPSVGDTAFFDGRAVAGYKNLGLSSFVYFSAGSIYSDPPFGVYATGSGRWWKLLRGFAPVGTFGTPDSAYAFPPGSPPSRFLFTGDPVTGTGYLDGQGQVYSPAPGDRRLLLNAGPFRMAPGDTQDVVMGVVAGIGADRLSSITMMRANDQLAQDAFSHGLPPSITWVGSEIAEVPNGLSLSQNYPNPFNPETEIRYQIPAYAGTEVRGQRSEVSRVKLTVCDLLGRTVAVLVDETLPAGTHRAIWNAVGHPSGIYFLRLESAGFTETKKMILIR